MTPFGEKLREMRGLRDMTLKAMAAGLHLSPAYLSALEHGRRGRPSRVLIIQIVGLLGLGWNETEELERLADLSHPRVVVDTGGLSARATELANRLAERIGDLTEDRIGRLLALLTASEIPSKTDPAKE